MNLELSLFDLLVMYGITFGIMNKIPQIHNRAALLDDLLACSYCTGFHAGWFMYFLHVLQSDSKFNLINIFCWSIASASFCYIIDTLVEYFEIN